MERKFKRFSAQKFTNERDIQFDPVDYSRFKFGCKSTARKFGTELARKFIASEDYSMIIGDLYENPDMRIVVMSSPYVHIPTATFAMKDYFIRILNEHIYRNWGFKPVIETKIYRSSSYKEEYGEMSKEERFKVMENDSFHVDSELLRDNICLFLDDIVITGAHEHRIGQMLNKYNLMNYERQYFLYYAELTSGETNPVIENYLNYAFVKDLVSLDKIIKNEEYLMNTRVVKYILNAPHVECKTFLTYQRQIFLQTLYHNAIGNSYHSIPDYKENMEYLEKILDKD
jgi:hypothetical protein